VTIRAAVGAGVGTLALVLAAAWLAAGAGGWRPGSPLPLLLDLIAVGLAGGLWIALRPRMARRLSERSVSRSMEVAAGLGEGEVQGALELGRSVPAGVSPALVARGERGLLARLGGDPAALAGPEGERARVESLRSGWFAATAMGLVVILGFSAPKRAAAAWGGLVRPLAVLAGPELPPVEVQPGTVELPRGSDLEIRVDAPLRREVTLVWQAAGDVVRRTPLTLSGGRGSTVLSAVTAEIEYRVEAPDGARSPTFAAIPFDPLFVPDVTLRLVFPEHTRRVVEEYRGDVPPLDLPAGTRIEVEGRGNRILGAAELRSGDGSAEPVALRVSGTDFEGAWVPRRSGRREWHIEDAEGVPAETLPAPLEVQVVPDAPPRVVILEPPGDTVLPLNLRQPLAVQAADDHGVAWLELVAWRVTALGDARPPVVQRIDAGEVPRVLVRPVMDVRSFELLPGDEVHYFVRVRDNGPGRQEARTPEQVLRMPAAEELRREAGTELDAGARLLEDLQDQAGRAAEEAREARRRGEAPPRGGESAAASPGSNPGAMEFSRREELRRAVEDEARRGRQVDSLRNALSEMSAALDEAGAQDSRMRSDLDELRSLLEELGGTAAQERLRDLMARVDDLDAGEAQEALAEMAERSEEYEARLEEAVERMQRAAARQDFATTTQEAESLARREEALAQALAEEAGPERVAQQEALSREAEALEQRMGELAARLQELGEDEAARGVAEAREGAQAARSGMQEAAGQAQAGQDQQAARSAQEAAETMDAAAREMMQAREEMMRERAEAFQRALRQTTQDALALARRQSGLRERMQGADAATLAQLRAEVAAVEQGAANAARTLALAARAARAGGGEREISATLGGALEELERTVTALDNPSAPGVPSPRVSAERAQARLNDAALQALAASRALSEGGQGQPSAQQATEQLEELAQQQAEVNNQASQMMPMDLTPQALEQQMQELARQQQQVASNVGQMSDQEGDGPLGDLQAMAREAEALARALEEGRLDATTRERQERLFHRLLDAGRSLEKEEESTEREADAPGVVEPGSVPPLDAGSLGLLRFRPDAGALRRLPPAARALVVRYFQRLNETAAPGTSPAGGGSGGGV
jgi:hypothetical protein